MKEMTSLNNNETRESLFDNYQRARRTFIQSPEYLIQLELYITQIVNDIIQDSYPEIEHDYNEASYLSPFWAHYAPDDRGRSSVGDQIPWIEVGEQAVGHKLCRIISQKFKISEIGLPSGADNRFVLYSSNIYDITGGLTNCAFVHLDIKSVGPRDNFDHTVLSPYQVSGDGIWDNPYNDIVNSEILASGARTSHVFYPAIPPIYTLTSGDIAPTIHLFVKPVYKMLSMISPDEEGQPLESVKNICVPNGLLLTCNPGYINDFPGLFFPGKDDRGKNPRKIRVRVSFDILRRIAPWRVSEFPQILQ